jgi:hypothetical protein
MRNMTNLELELQELKSRVERLELTVVHWMRGGHRQVAPAGTAMDQEQLLAWLREEGLVRDPTSEERRLAAEWDDLPEAEKEAHIESMRCLVLAPPLSQIIADARR